LNDDNSTELNILAATAYLQQTNLAAGVALIEKEIAHHPDNSDLLNNAAQVFLAQGLYTNALHAIKLKLALNPNDPGSLDNLGYAYMQMKDYSQAIASLTSVLRLQPTNNDALFNRAIALLSAGQLDAARSDYQQLQKAFPKSFQVAYGLGEIAWRQHATNDAIANYHLYLANAPTNTAEARLIGQRLAGLQGKSP
jgi:tetratricopeptide (TPR) repeat protein